MSAKVPGKASETWASINIALSMGYRGLPGGTTLCRLLAEHRGIHHPRDARALSVEQILEWADHHHAATGDWPTIDSGAVLGADGERWSALNEALSRGRRGLPGGGTLRRLLDAHRPVQRNWLTVEQIRAWGEAHRAATGQWPGPRSGAVAVAPGETWQNINQALSKGCRGLPGGTTLNDLFGDAARHRPARGWPRVCIPEILAWADAHHAATGRWPTTNSGPVRDAPYALNWSAVQRALVRGYRGLPGGQTLARLLEEERGYTPRMSAKAVRARAAKLRRLMAARGGRVRRDTLSAQQILEAAEAHHAATGRWPSRLSGPIAAIPGDTWYTVNRALVLGLRGLPGGSSLARLMAEQLPAYSRVLTVEAIVAWGEAHHARHGRWPTRKSGPVIGALGEKWPNLEEALRTGGRGLPAGLSLARLFAGRKDPGSGQSGVTVHGGGTATDDASSAGNITRVAQ
jgi:hypothetical protein